MRLTSSDMLWVDEARPLSAAVSRAMAYAARQGVDPDTFAERLRPILTPDQVAATVTEVVANPLGAAEYQVSGAGLRPVG